MVFLTIEPTPGLGDERRRSAHRLGPVAVAVPTSYQSLLRSAGFVEVDAVDLTGDYLSTQRRWIDATERNAATIQEAMGADLFAERHENRLSTLRAIEDGLLARFRYSAIRPLQPRR